MPTWTNGLSREENIIGWQGKRIAALERELAELREAVRWERNAMRVFNEACMPDAGYGEITWAAENLEKARAAVDALVGGE